MRAYLLVPGGSMEKKDKRNKFIFFNIYNRFSDSASFKTRLFLAFILIAIPILAVVSIGSFIVLKSSVEETMRKSEATELEKAATQIEYVVNDTENMSREIIMNPSVQEMLTKSYKGEQYPEDSSVAYYVNAFLANRDFINSVVLTGLDHTLFSTERAYTDLSAFNNIKEKWWYRILKSGDEAYSWFSWAQLNTVSYKNQKKTGKTATTNMLMLTRPINSMSDYSTKLGYMMIYLNDDYMQKIWDSIDWGETSGIFLFDENNLLITSNQSSLNYRAILSQLDVQTGNQIIKFNGIKYVVSRADMSSNNWTICMITPYNEVNGGEVALKAQLLLVVAVIILILFLMSKFSANNMAQPIIKLSGMMDSYHGADQELDLELLDIYEKRTDEVGQMFRSYKQLEERMNKLIQEIYVKNLEKKDAELALLQTQINPHFLYNTLDSINWLALANGQDKISDMITALSATFRLSLMRNTSSFGEIDHEIQYIKSYLILQKFRYADRLTYFFDLPDKIPTLYIPRFILQPVVENALKHGIDQTENGGEIIIHLETNENVLFTVTNDGTDIDCDDMEKLLYFDPNSTDILAFQKGGYGVQNIHRRIKLICGDAYGISYEKTQAKTICRILLPIKTEL